MLSVAVLHWVPEAEHPAVLAGDRPVPEAGMACFRADFGGAGQVEATRAVIDPISRSYGGLGLARGTSREAEEYAASSSGPG